MDNLVFGGKKYQVDSGKFLLDYNQWDDNFAEGLAPSLKIPHGLSKRHWDIINYIRKIFMKIGKCPLVYQTCRANKLRLKELQGLFPTGYLRGACKLAGITYKEAYHGFAFVPAEMRATVSATPESTQVVSEETVQTTFEKTYVVDVRGFLVNPDDWDELYASFKAYEMMPSEDLTKKHWEVIHFLRNSYKKNGVVPTIYETCKANNLEIEDIERLFPGGYHRCAVKISGLKVR